MEVITAKPWPKTRYTRPSEADMQRTVDLLSVDG